MVDPITEVWRRSEMLETALKECKSRGRAAAEAEMNYRVALAERILVLRENGLPATLIGDVARGTKEIARLKFERDCARSCMTTRKRPSWSTKSRSMSCGSR